MRLAFRCGDRTASPAGLGLYSATRGVDFTSLWGVLVSTRIFCAAAAALLALFGAADARAQVLYGSIVGNVRDASEAPVPAAIVSATNTQTNQSRQTLTTDSGGYTFSTLPTGTYDIVIRRDGFQTVTRSGIPVTINSVARVDVSLQVGTVNETVDVTAAAPLLQSDRSEVGAEIATRTLRDLPVPAGRNYQNLFVAVQGFSPPANQHSVPTNPARALRFNVNGTSASSNNVRVDGASQYNVWLPHITAYVPALESIETVNVVTNSFDAEQGLAGGAAINVQIKSGTNDIHGSAFGYHTDNKLKAKPFFIPQGERNPKRVNNQFGGNIGGPIKHDKLFYFLSYEGNLDRQFAFRNVTIPLLPMRTGNLSGSAAPIYDPATGNPDGTGRTPFAGNVIPADRIDPAAAKVIGLLPAPTSGDRLVNNYYASAPYSFDRHIMDSKLNWNVSSKLSMYGRFSMLRYTMLNRQAFGDAGGPAISAAGDNPGTADGGTYSATVAATYVFTPTFIVDANFGYTKMNTQVEQARLNENLGLDFLGIPGTNGTRGFEGGWPRFQVTDFAEFGHPNEFMPYIRRDPQYQYVANASWTKGTHNLRFGADVARLHLNHTQPEFPGAFHGAAGGFTFNGGPTALNAPGAPAPNQYNNFAAFLLGLPTRVGKILQVPDVYTTRTSMYSLFFRDQWQVSRRLTINAGVRWEYFPLPTRADRGMERYDFANNKMLVCGVGVVPEDCGVEIQKDNFAPRFGIAYRATDTVVIRAGYGITNDPYNLARPLRTNYPVLFVYNQEGANSFAPAGSLRTGIPPLAPPDLGNGIIDVPRNAAVNSLPEKFTRGYIQSWNLTVQKQIGANWSAQAGYVATRSIRQLGFLDLNVARPGGGNASRAYFQRFGRTVDTRVVGPVGNGQYDALQTSLERRFAAGMQFRVGYTWSKAMGICCNRDSDGTPEIHLPEYYNLNRAPTVYDRTHNFQASWIAELPFGPGRRWARDGVAAALGGGWQINGLFSSYSGRPFSVEAAGASLNAAGNRQRADQVKPEVKKLGGVGPGQPFYDPLAFRSVTDARFGTAGFNSLRGPGLVNLDAGLFREFRMTEQWRLQFRAEALNFTNTPHFNVPGNDDNVSRTNVSNMQLNSDGSIRSLGNFMQITGTTNTGRDGIDERVFRLGLRLSF